MALLCSVAPRRAQQQSWGRRSFSRERGEERTGPAEQPRLSSGGGAGGAGVEAGASTGLGPAQGWGEVSGTERGASSQSTGDVLRWGFALKGNRQ